MNRFFISRIVITLVLVAAAAYGLHAINPSFRFSHLMGANGLMFLLSLVAWLLIRKSLYERPHAFVRGVNAAKLLKLMVCMGAIFTYALLNRESLYKPVLFVFFGIYVVYTAVETWITSSMAKHVK